MHDVVVKRLSKVSGTLLLTLHYNYTTHTRTVLLRRMVSGDADHKTVAMVLVVDAVNSTRPVFSFCKRFLFLFIRKLNLRLEHWLLSF